MSAPLSLELTILLVRMNLIEDHFLEISPVHIGEMFSGLMNHGARSSGLSVCIC